MILGDLSNALSNMNIVAVDNRLGYFIQDVFFLTDLSIELLIAVTAFGLEK